MGALDAAVRRGWPAMWAISSYGPARTEEAIGILSGLGTPR